MSMHYRRFTRYARAIVRLTPPPRLQYLTCYEHNRICLNHRWCHVLCAVWIPETTFRDPDAMDCVLGCNRISKARQELRCTLCKQQHGACIQCAGAGRCLVPAVLKSINTPAGRDLMRRNCLFCRAACRIPSLCPLQFA